ncbi:hypothetical protein NC653_017511 [Populus alba x Populus x berolinensis]|uniref:Uncharacterized protein n=1 Tax=Populus alba x Populus x berolinensis TaxID=444605 RepID=A0AAD6QQM5_9ROSI|nr:hypothetical protein NC653_017511 [Populus alba x Populus x berolinensis]
MEKNGAFIRWNWLVTDAYLEWKFLLSEALIKGSVFFWPKNHKMFGRLTSFELWRICFCIRFNGGSYFVARDAQGQQEHS